MIKLGRCGKLYETYFGLFFRNKITKCKETECGGCGRKKWD